MQIMTFNPHAREDSRSGTRNNIIMSLLLPILLWILYAKNKVFVSILSIMIVIGLSLFFADEFRAFFNPVEVSNDIKLKLVEDYLRIFSEPRNLFLGQGLGAYTYWYAKGIFCFITELTYLDMVRNFGLFGALILFSLLLFPIWYAFFKTHSSSLRAVAISFGAYLIMCASNPNLFSSTGILILAVILGRIYLPIQGANELKYRGALW